MNVNDIRVSPLSARPTSVRIGPVTWSVSFDHAAIRRIQQNASENFLGRTNSNTCEMHIDDFGQPENAIRTTLLHEVLHAIWISYGVDGDHIEKREREELVIGRLEAPLLCCLRDNPLLVHYLLDIGDHA